MNDFTANFINRLDQFGETSFDLVITHAQGVIPDCRVTKTFNHEPGNPIDESRLQEVAANEIERLVSDWNEVQSLEDNDPEVPDA